MNEMFENAVFFGVTISLCAYGLGLVLQKKFKMTVFNPLLISIVITMLVLKFGNISYEKYNEGAKYLSYFLTPATVCLAVPLYEKIELLKSNWKAIIAGIVSGVITSLGSILAMAAFFKLDHKEYVTFLPKSITTAIGMGVAEELGGYVTLTVAVIIVTGIFGNVFASAICKIFKITDPIAVGIAIGTASHAVGTARAMEIGETEGAMSSLSIAVAGLITVVGASIFANFM
ncbi:MAG: LrgB family protein [Lachnospiraceae bacterium]|nr:LrgB family protein [Lachnospiraceae bacterium]